MYRNERQRKARFQNVSQRNIRSFLSFMFFQSSSYLFESRRTFIDERSNRDIDSIIRYGMKYCENASFRCSPLQRAYIKCKLPYGLICLNVITKSNNTQNAVLLKEFWKKRRDATRSRWKPDNPKTRKIDNVEKFKTVLSNTIWSRVSQGTTIADPQCNPKRPYVRTSSDFRHGKTLVLLYTDTCNKTATEQPQM